MSCGVCTRILCSQKRKRAPASWDKMLNVLFRMSEVKLNLLISNFSLMPSLADNLSHLSAASFHFPDMSVLTVMCSLECRRRPNRTGTPSLIKTTYGKTVGCVPLSIDIGTISDQRPGNGSCCNSSYQVLPLATGILNGKVLCIIDTVQHNLNKSGILSLLLVYIYICRFSCRFFF